ncbi:FecR family protein [Balneolaceae bacterium ANBcel3]|nr:FecR family protein [Balneolaceae bacterium ANBcel3]
MNMKWDLLARYHTGQVTEDEKKQVNRWIRQSSSNEEKFLFMKKVYGSSFEQEFKWDPESSWKRFKNKIKEENSESRQLKKDLSTKHRGASSSRYSWILVAAILLVSVFISLFLQRNAEQGVEEKVLYRTVETDMGVRTTFVLPDRSEVMLKPGSRITFPETFIGREERYVELKGAALFNVAPSSRQSFIVVSERAVTEVLGTRFLFRSYEEDQADEVYVFSGSVSFLGSTSKPHEAVTLFSKQAGKIGHGDTYVQVSHFEDEHNLLSWVDGGLAFDQEPLWRVLNSLERWYGIRLDIGHLESDLTEKKITAAFHRKQPVKEVLEAVAMTVGIQYEKRNNVYHFTN